MLLDERGMGHMTTDDNSVIIEPEEQASERSQKETAGKKQRKKIGRFYRWQIVLVVVIAVVAVSGLGFYKWHESPSFCDAICHNPQDPYNPTYFAEPGQPATDKWGNDVADARGMLSAAHRVEADSNCLSCHVPTIKEQLTEGVEWVTGNFYNPLSERSLDNLERWKADSKGEYFCLNSACHDMSKEELSKVYEDWDRNPHSWHHTEYTCSDCHKSHRASVMVCSQCHDDSTLPEGWISFEESQQLETTYIAYDLEPVVYGK